MWFGVLGPLRVTADGAQEPLLVSAGRLRALLAVLLWRVNQPVPVDELSELVWDGAPPRNASGALRALVLRLRRALGAQAGARIRTRSPGYLVELSDDELDATRFEVLCADTGAAVRAGSWADAAGTAALALELWRGAPLADVPCQALHDAWVPHLEQRRLQVLEWRVEADLRLGRQDRVVSELRELTVRHPLRERFHAQLMLALAGIGRQAEALEAYQRARRSLVDQLGIEPGAELRDLQERILAGDPGLHVEPPARVDPERAPLLDEQPPRPAQLPADLIDFVGRDSQVKHLASQLTDRRALSVAAITGVGGIGKTSLAVHVAHRIAADFPDGQLYAPLRGATAQPRPASDVLARFLRDLGVPDAAVPVDEEERVVRYRSLLAGRRVLVLLDDARDAAQIRPLLPGAAGCAVLVTGRTRLSGLDGATVVDLDALETPEAGALFAGIVGPDRTAGEPAATATVLRACDGFPLAIRIAANRLATRPGWSVRALADRLADERSRLRELNVADLAIRITFQTSYHALPAADDGIDPARAFRLLGLAPGPSVSLSAAAVLFDTAQARAEQALETLVDAHLLTAPESGRYRFHDLLRVYAAECADADETARVRTDAVHRLLDWYLNSATAADQVLDPRPRRRIAVAEDMPGLRFAGYQQAMSWFDSEHETLLAAIGQAAEIGAHDLASRFMVRLGVFLGRRCHWADLIMVSRVGQASAKVCGDRVGEADALFAMSNGFFRRNDVQSGQDASREALAIYRELGDLQGQIAATGNLGYSYLWSGRLDQAAELMERAVAIAQAGAGRPYEARSLGNLGYVYNELGQHDRALACCERALMIASDSENATFDQALAGVHLGRAHYCLGRHAEATEQLRRALDLAERLGAHELHGLALMYLGDIEHDLGVAESAERTWQQAHHILVRVSHVFARQAADRLARIG